MSPCIHRRRPSRLIPVLTAAFLVPFLSPAGLAAPAPEPSAPDSALQAARTYFDAHAVRLAESGAFPDDAYEQLKAYRLILVGEMHGTREAPQLMLELVKLLRRKGQKVFLGLELPSSCQQGVDRYRASGDRRDLEALAFFQRPLPEQDGRSSKAMADLILATRTMPDVQLVCIDAPAQPGQTRDAAMAECLDRQLRGNADGMGVVLTGNLHTKMSPVSLAQGLYHPMGDELVHRRDAAVERSRVLAINLESEELSAWEVTDRASGIITYPVNRSWYAQMAPWNGYFLVRRREYEGYDAVIFWRQMTPSDPFVEAKTLPQHSMAGTEHDAPASSGSQPELAAELQGMYRLDQAIRGQLRAAAATESAPLWQECARVDAQNTTRLKAIIQQYGWPTKELVGEEGAHFAWLLVQHADQDVRFQEACLPLLLEAAQRGEGALSDVAYLTDRVRVNEGKKQVYGTQFTVENGRRVPKPIEDPDQVELRRAKMGLNSLADYTKQMYDFYGQPAEKDVKGKGRP